MNNFQFFLCSGEEEIVLTVFIVETNVLFRVCQSGVMVEVADTFLTAGRIQQIQRFTYLSLPYKQKKKVLQLYFYKCWF